MEDPKITLSPTQLKMVCDPEIILTKNTIITKAIALLATVQDSIHSCIPGDSHTAAVPPKISKGENYLGLPYAVLDFPRLSNADGICMIRTMFWWGHYFSSTLQVSGTYRNKVLGRLDERHSFLSESDYFFGVSDDPWQHHFGNENYRSVKEFTAAALKAALSESAHIKLAAKWPLEEWENMPQQLTESWKNLYRLIS